MKVVILAGLSVLISLPVEAGQRHRQNTSPMVTCDNDGHCTTFNASAPVPRLRGSRLKIRDKTIDAATTPAGPDTATAAAAGTAIATATPTHATSGTATDTTTLAAPEATTTPTMAVAVPDVTLTEPASVPLPKPRAAVLGANGNAAGIIATAATPAAAGTAIATATPATSDAATDTTTLAAPETITTPTTVAVPDTVTITEPAPVPLPKPRSAALGVNGDAAGIIISSKTGARTRVGVAYAARFQAYIDDLEKNYGARILFMGGLRPGRCSIFGEHPCGKALDVCQLRRGVVDPRCNLPGHIALGRIAASHGLFEGGRWCNSDYGHAQVDVTAPACGDPPLLMVRQMDPQR